MNMIAEMAIGIGVMFQSAFQLLKLNFLKSTYVVIALLLFAHYLLTKANQNKAHARLRWLVVFLIVFASVAGFLYFRQMTLNAYAHYVPTMEPLDLKINYHGAMESRLYEMSVGEDANWHMTAVFMPPVFAFMRFSTFILGDTFEVYYRNYRICGILAAALTLFMLIYFAMKKLGRESTSDIVIAAFAINTFLFLLFYFVTDIRIGNTNVFVGFLVTAQLCLTLWKRPFSKFSQAFLFLLAWWIKPNMVLVIWALTVFSLSRREYAYLTGLLCGIVAPVLASLLATNISLETYLIYFTEVSKIIEQAALVHSSNLSIFYIFDNPVLAYKIALIAAGLIVLWYTIRVKDPDFLRFEIFCFLITYLFWTRVWAYYFIPVAVITWVNMVERIKRGRQIYFELLLVLFLSMSLALINAVGVNLTLAVAAVVCVGQHVPFFRTQMAPSSGSARLP
ncbi:MAG: hypothetical protein Kow0099_04770 [Candidatus Abyssubacteria bacterium]